MRQRLISPITDGLLSPTSQWLSTEGNINTTISTSGVTVWVAVQYKQGVQYIIVIDYTHINMQVIFTK